MLSPIEIVEEVARSHKRPRLSLQYRATPRQSRCTVAPCESVASSTPAVSPWRQGISVRTTNPRPRLAAVLSFLGNTSRGPAPSCGLFNLGNTCYANATLQALYRTRALKATIERLATYAQMGVEDATLQSALTLVRALHNLFVAMADIERSLSQRANETRRTPPISEVSHAGSQATDQNESECYSSDRKRAVSADGVIAAVRAISMGFEKQAQHDAHEFLVAVMAALDDVTKAMQKDSLGDATLHTGLLRITTQCRECEAEHHRDEPFMDLAVTVNPDGDTSLGHALSQLVTPETYACLLDRMMLDGDNKYRCESCLGRTEASRRTRIATLPQVLVVHIKRFSFDIRYFGIGSGRSTKLCSALPCPETLRLREWCETNTEGRDKLYELQSMILHHGLDMSAGHYTAFVRDGHAWAYIDDDTAQVAEAEDVARILGASGKSASTPYILIYERRS